jgi:hypothetical protein
MVSRQWAYFDFPGGYHSQPTAWKPGWRDAIGDYALGESPFGEGCVVLAGPPGWFLHF